MVVLGTEVVLAQCHPGMEFKALGEYDQCHPIPAKTGKEGG